MKKPGLQVACLSLLVVLATTIAGAQTKIAVRVPFNFHIANKEFPAGGYTVYALRDHLTVEEGSGKVIFIGIANSVGGRHVGETGQVIFKCYDRSCFLSEFWTPTRETGSQLLRSLYEAELAGHQKGTEFALVGKEHK